jgi:hypothetical protein
LPVTCLVFVPAQSRAPVACLLCNFSSLAHQVLDTSPARAFAEASVSIYPACWSCHELAPDHSPQPACSY